MCTHVCLFNVSMSVWHTVPYRVSTYSSVSIKLHGTLVISVSGDTSWHLAAWFVEHGNSLIAEDQICPVALTKNATLASNPQRGDKRSSESRYRQTLLAYNYVCNQNVRQLFSSGK